MGSVTSEIFIFAYLCGTGPNQIRLLRLFGLVTHLSTLQMIRFDDFTFTHSATESKIPLIIQVTTLTHTPSLCPVGRHNTFMARFALTDRGTSGRFTPGRLSF